MQKEEDPDIFQKKKEGPSFLHTIRKERKKLSRPLNVWAAYTPGASKSFASAECPVFFFSHGVPCLVCLVLHQVFSMLYDGQQHEMRISSSCRCYSIDLSCPRFSFWVSL